MIQGDSNPQASSLQFPLVAVYSFIWYHQRMSHRNEFTSLYETEREFQSSLKSRDSIMQTPE